MNISQMFRCAMIFAQLFLITFFCSTIVRADGEIDKTFKATAYAADSVSINKSVVLPDGKVYVAGGFTAVNGIAREAIVRLNEDGSVDPQFSPRLSSKPWWDGPAD